jgi:hypothetical protein
MQAYLLTISRCERPSHPIQKLATQGGSVVIEFVLIAPLMLFILGYSLRLTQLLQANQIAMIVSREAATEAFRTCADLTILSSTCNTDVCVNIPQTVAATNTCIGRIKSTYESRWNIMRPSANPGTVTIDVEVYRFGLDRYTTSLNCTVQLGTADKTRVSTNSMLDDPFTSGTALGSLCRRNRATRARISFPLNPVTSFLNLIPGFSASTSTVVDDTVI